MVARSSWSAAPVAAVLGLAAAVLLLVLGALPGGRLGPNAQEVALMQMHQRQVRAMAAAHSRFAGHKFSMLEGEEEEAADAAPAGNSTNATNATDCVSWRGCKPNATEMLPYEVQFECGGAAQTQICYEANKACIESAETGSTAMYKVSPFDGVHARKKNACACFESNGCRPSCNVAMYLRWSTSSGINCPAKPPVYHATSGVYQYGNPDDSYVSPSDFSFDYYPEFPNPAGHKYNRPWVRDTYEDEPGIGAYQEPLLADYGEGYTDHVIVSGNYNPYHIWDSARKGKELYDIE